MTDLALQVAGSKLAISVVLGGAVWLAARGHERPHVSHALCVALLAALLIPPLVALPVLNPGIATAGPVGAASLGAIRTLPLPEGVDGSGHPVSGGAALIFAWILGTIALAGWTIARVRGFRRSLRRASRGASPDLQRMAQEIGRTLGLRKVPTIETTDAVVSPMVYWSGGTARVLIPTALVQGMERSRLRWILAHELAHVRRRDHLVRWLEWLACAAFWWNPIAWWASRRLRAVGEICCDALVVNAFGCAPRDYARSLVRALDLVRTEQTSRPPAFASAAHSGRRTRHLEGRLRMIIDHTPAGTLSPALRAVLRCGLVVLLAFGLVYCSERTPPTAVSPTAVEVPGSALPLLNLTTADLEVVELPPAEGLVSPAEGDVIPGTVRMSGKKYGELMTTLEGLQACASCHDGDLTAEQRVMLDFTAVILDFTATVESTDDGGWNLQWEFSQPHGDLSTHLETRKGVTILSPDWFPPGTIERIVVDQPPPPGR